MEARKGPFLRTAFNYDMDKASVDSGLRCLDESMAQQQFAEECDINTIVKRFGLTGEMPENVRVPQYGDFSGIGDYQSALNAVRDAEESFMELPAHIRARFGHDPQQLLEFVADGRNLEEARRLGLVPELSPDEIARVQAAGLDPAKTLVQNVPPAPIQPPG